MKKIKIDLEELVLSFGFDEEELAKEYFDRETGEIINIPRDVMMVVEGKLEEGELEEWQAELLEDAKAVFNNFGDRFLSIPNVRENYFYEAMLEFVQEMVNNSSIKERLKKALNSFKPMREFKNALIDYPGEQELWYEYEDKKYKEYVITWLKDNKVEFECI